jgi:allophanate hydrolase
VFELAAWFDPDAPLARSAEADVMLTPGSQSNFRFGVPPEHDLDFFSDRATGALFGAAIGLLQKAGGTPVETSLAPFREAGRLLYDGPWLAERLHVTETLLSDNPSALLPITRSVIEGARRYSALDAFRAQYKLAALRRVVDRAFMSFDLILLPTAGAIYEIREVTADPLRLNANLGLYTNFVNLLDCAAIALPGGFDDRGLPFGISLIAPAFRDRMLLELGARFQKLTGLPHGAAAG